MPGKLEFKISAVDDTQKAFTSASVRADKMLEQYKELSKAGLGPSGEIKGLKKMENQFKKISNEIKNMNKQLKPVSGGRGTAGRSGAAVESGVATAGGMMTSEADVAIASKTREIGRSLQISKDKTKEMAQSLQTGGKAFSNEIEKAKKNMSSISRSAREMKGIGMGGGGRGGFGGGGGGGGGAIDIGSFGAKQAQETGKATVIPFLGVALAAGAAAYLMGTKMASAYGQAGGQQIRGMQTLGRAGGSRPGGFYAGYANLGITGAEQVGMMSQYAKQTGITGPDADSTYNKRMETMARISSAYGIGAGQVSGYGGTFDRYVRSENKRGSTMSQAIVTAEKTGMGGARLPEFLDAVKNSLEEAVANGSQVSNKELVNALGMMTSTSDQRLKSMAPGILQAGGGSFRQAAMFKGGASEAFAMEAVYAQMKRDDPEATIWDARVQLSKGADVKNVKAMISGARRRSPGNEKRAATMLQQLPMFSKISDPNQMLKVMKMIDTYPSVADGKLKSASGGKQKGIQAYLDDRLGGKGISEARNLTLKKGVLDEQMNLNIANKEATEIVVGFKEGILNATKTLEDFANAFAKAGKADPTKTKSFKKSVAPGGSNYEAWKGP